MSINTEKSPAKWSSRLSFLRTKRAIGAISLVLVVAIVLIALAGTHTIGAKTSSDTNKDAAASQSAYRLVGTTPSTAPATAKATALASNPTTALSTKSSSTRTASSSPTDSSTSSSTSQTSQGLANGTPLRVMCLGASVVKGETSPGTIGFRKVLRDDLADFGNQVNMVGSVRLGDMIDNDVEAYGGVTINTIFGYAKKIVPKTLPNVYVVNAGTNNILQVKDVDTAGEDMKAFVDYLLTTSSKSVVIMSTILTNAVAKEATWCGDSACEDLVLNVNAQLRALMPTFEKEDQRVILAEVHPSEGGGDEIPQLSDLGPDGTHPLVSGYEKMGHIYSKAVAAADAKGWIEEAADNGIPADGDAERSGSSRRRRR